MITYCDLIQFCILLVALVGLVYKICKDILNLFPTAESCIRQIQKEQDENRLGHTDTQTTLNIYSHFNRQRLNTSTNDLYEISMASADLFA